MHMKTSSTSRKELGKNRRNLKLLKEKSIFLLHILIGRITKKQKFWKILEKFSAESFEKLFLCYGMNVHDFKWSSKPKFSKKNSTLSNFLTLFFSHIPKKIALNTSRNLILEGHKTQHTITCTKFNKVLLVVCATCKCMRYSQGDM